MATKDANKFVRQMLIHFIVFVFVFSSCISDGRKSIFVQTTHYAGAAGLTWICTLDENSLQVETNCDLSNCKKKIVYQRTFTENESDSINKFVSSLALNSLKTEYVNWDISDGLFSNVTFINGFLSTKTITLGNYYLPKTDSLFAYMDKLILTKKYRFENWGEE